jgi:hypothetical protein
METGKNQAVTSPGNMVNVPKLSHCAWKGTFRPPITDVRVCCCAEETGYFCAHFSTFFLLTASLR